MKDKFLQKTGDWKNFFTEMKEQHFATFLVQEFSTDPDYLRSGAMQRDFMVNPRLATISWNTFWMSDAEKNALVKSVMAEYLRFESVLFVSS